MNGWVTREGRSCRATIIDDTANLLMKEGNR